MSQHSFNFLHDIRQVCLIEGEVKATIKCIHFIFLISGKKDNQDCVLLNHFYKKNYLSFFNDPFVQKSHVLKNTQESRTVCDRKTRKKFDILINYQCTTNKFVSQMTRTPSWRIVCLPSLRNKHVILEFEKRVKRWSWKSSSSKLDRIRNIGKGVNGLHWLWAEW